jgi:hypothetical protein
VSVMNRIEGAAEEAERGWGTRCHCAT